MLRPVALIAGLAFAGPAMAQFYTADELAHTKARAVPSIIKVFDEDILGLLPRELRPRAAEIRLSFPDYGADKLGFYAYPDTQTVEMPLASIRFFDDVATVFAWFDSKGCDPAVVQAYLYELLRKGQPLPSPLRAFAIDRDAAFADPFTYDVSGKIVSSGIQFILAHEVGHLLLDHRGGLTGAASQTQEIEADEFALDHFARLGGLPLGVLYFYLAAWWQDPVDDAVVSSSTHPVSPLRMARLAERLGADPMSFAHGEADPAREAEYVRQIAGMVATVAQIADDDGLLTLLPQALERDYPASRFARACPSG